MGKGKPRTEPALQGGTQLCKTRVALLCAVLCCGEGTFFTAALNPAGKGLMWGLHLQKQ